MSFRYADKDRQWIVTIDTNEQKVYIPVDELNRDYQELVSTGAIDYVEDYDALTPAKQAKSLAIRNASNNAMEAVIPAADRDLVLAEMVDLAEAKASGRRPVTPEEDAYRDVLLVKLSEIRGIRTFRDAQYAKVDAATTVEEVEAIAETQAEGPSL